MRILLVLMAAGLIAVFYTAFRVQPYAPDGTPLRMASHQSLGLPPCSFNDAVGVPCPSCGMTTSFAHLVRGNLWSSLRANWVGTGLALFLMVGLPWSIWTAVRGRYLWVRSLEGPLALAVGLLTVLMLLRWGIVLLIAKFG